MTFPLNNIKRRQTEEEKSKKGYCRPEEKLGDLDLQRRNVAKAVGNKVVLEQCVGGGEVERVHFDQEFLTCWTHKVPANFARKNSHAFQTIFSLQNSKKQICEIARLLTFKSFPALHHIKKKNV